MCVHETGGGEQHAPSYDTLMLGHLPPQNSCVIWACLAGKWTEQGLYSQTGPALLFTWLCDLERVTYPLWALGKENNCTYLQEL